MFWGKVAISKLVRFYSFIYHFDGLQNYWCVHVKPAIGTAINTKFGPGCKQARKCKLVVLWLGWWKLTVRVITLALELFQINRSPKTMFASWNVPWYGTTSHKRGFLVYLHILLYMSTRSSNTLKYARRHIPPSSQCLWLTSLITNFEWSVLITIRRFLSYASRVVV